MKLLLLFIMGLATAASLIKEVPDSLWNTNYGKFGTTLLCANSITGIILGSMAAIFAFIAHLLIAMVSYGTTPWSDLIQLIAFEFASLAQIWNSSSLTYFCNELGAHLVS